MSAVTLQSSITPRLLTRKALAAYLSMTESKVAELVEAGKLPPPVKIGVRYYYDRHAVDERVDAWFADRQEQRSQWDEAVALS